MLHRNHQVVLFAEGPGKVITGATSPGYQDGDALSAKFDLPSGLCAVSASLVYVADPHRNVIRVVSKSQERNNNGGRGDDDDDDEGASNGSPRGNHHHNHHHHHYEPVPEPFSGRHSDIDDSDNDSDSHSGFVVFLTFGLISIVCIAFLALKVYRRRDASRGSPHMLDDCIAGVCSLSCSRRSIVQGCGGIIAQIRMFWRHRRMRTAAGSADISNRGVGRNNTNAGGLWGTNSGYHRVPQSYLETTF